MSSRTSSRAGTVGLPPSGAVGDGAAARGRASNMNGKSAATGHSSRSGSRSSLSGRAGLTSGSFVAKADAARANTLNATASTASLSSLPPSRAGAGGQQASSTAPINGPQTVALSVALLSEAIQASGSEFIAEVSNKNISSFGKALESFPTLRSLNLSFNALTTTKGIEAAADLRELKGYGNHLASLQGIDKCKKLERLLLNSNDLAESALAVLGECKFLKQLRLDHNRLSSSPSSGLAGMFDKCLSLQDLDISDNYAIRSLHGLKLRLLMNLRASGNAVTELPILSLVGVPALEELHLDRNSITSLAGLAPLSKLMVLQLDHNQLTSLSSLPKLPLLTELYLAHNRLTEILPGDLTAEKFPSLEVLDLSHNFLGHSSAADVNEAVIRSAKGGSSGGGFGAASKRKVEGQDQAEGEEGEEEEVKPFPLPILASNALKAAFGNLSSLSSSLAELYVFGNPISVAIEQGSLGVPYLPPSPSGGGAGGAGDEEGEAIGSAPKPNDAPEALTLYTPLSPSAAKSIRLVIQGLLPALSVIDDVELDNEGSGKDKGGAAAAKAGGGDDEDEDDDDYGGASASPRSKRAAANNNKQQAEGTIVGPGGQLMSPRSAAAAAAAAKQKKRREEEEDAGFEDAEDDEEHGEFDAAVDAAKAKKGGASASAADDERKSARESARARPMSGLVAVDGPGPGKILVPNAKAFLKAAANRKPGQPVPILMRPPSAINKKLEQQKMMMRPGSALQQQQGKGSSMMSPGHHLLESVSTRNPSCLLESVSTRNPSCLLESVSTSTRPESGGGAGEGKANKKKKPKAAAASDDPNAGLLQTFLDRDEIEEQTFKVRETLRKAKEEMQARLTAAAPKGSDFQAFAASKAQQLTKNAMTSLSSLGVPLASVKASGEEDAVAPVGTMAASAALFAAASKPQQAQPSAAALKSPSASAAAPGAPVIVPAVVNVSLVAASRRPVAVAGASATASNASNPSKLRGLRQALEFGQQQDDPAGEEQEAIGSGFVKSKALPPAPAATLSPREQRVARAGAIAESFFPSSSSALGSSSSLGGGLGGGGGGGSIGARALALAAEDDYDEDDTRLASGFRAAPPALAAVSQPQHQAQKAPVPKQKGDDENEDDGDDDEGEPVDGTGARFVSGYLQKATAAGGSSSSSSSALLRGRDAHIGDRDEEEDRRMADLERRLMADSSEGAVAAPALQDDDEAESGGGLNSARSMASGDAKSRRLSSVNYSSFLNASKTKLAGTSSSFLGSTTASAFTASSSSSATFSAALSPGSSGLPGVGGQRKKWAYTGGATEDDDRAERKKAEQEEEEAAIAAMMMQQQHDREKEKEKHLSPRERKKLADIETVSALPDEVVPSPITSSGVGGGATAAAGSNNSDQVSPASQASASSPTSSFASRLQKGINGLGGGGGGGGGGASFLSSSYTSSFSSAGGVAARALAMLNSSSPDDRPSAAAAAAASSKAALAKRRYDDDDEGDEGEDDAAEREMALRQPALPTPVPAPAPAKTAGDRKLEAYLNRKTAAGAASTAATNAPGASSVLLGGSSTTTAAPFPATSAMSRLGKKDLDALLRGIS